jgi:hypothetical protein
VNSLWFRFKHTHEKKKGSPEVELGLEVVEPCRLVAEKILVAEINLK